MALINNLTTRALFSTPEQIENDFRMESKRRLQLMLNNESLQGKDAERARWSIENLKKTLDAR